MCWQNGPAALVEMEVRGCGEGVMEGVQAIVQTVELCAIVVDFSAMACEIGVLTLPPNRLRSNMRLERSEIGWLRCRPRCRL